MRGLAFSHLENGSLGTDGLTPSTSDVSPSRWGDLLEAVVGEVVCVLIFSLFSFSPVQKKNSPCFFKNVSRKSKAHFWLKPFLVQPFPSSRERGRIWSFRCFKISRGGFTKICSTRFGLSVLLCMGTRSHVITTSDARSDLWGSWWGESPLTSLCETLISRNRM